jgi:hypothetical protein
MTRLNTSTEPEGEIVDSRISVDNIRQQLTESDKAMADISPQAVERPKHSKFTASPRGKGTTEERAEKNRERNREHAKRTRLRKKDMIEGMKMRLLELQREVSDCLIKCLNNLIKTIFTVACTTGGQTRAAT